jgi:hypothetical protein
MTSRYEWEAATSVLKNLIVDEAMQAFLAS